MAVIVSVDTVMISVLSAGISVMVEVIKLVIVTMLVGVGATEVEVAAVKVVLIHLDKAALVRGLHLDPAPPVHDNLQVLAPEVHSSRPNPAAQALKAYQDLPRALSRRN